MLGKVTFFDGKKGYGYIVGDDGRNYFIDAGNVCTVSHSLAKGYVVDFTPCKNSHRYEAEDAVLC